MANFYVTDKDGNQINIDPKMVKRVRRVLVGEDDSGKTQTRIDWPAMLLVKESVDVVAANVKAEMEDRFAAVSAEDGSEIWFDGSRARGPVKITQFESNGGVYKCAVDLGYKQFAREKVSQVRDLIAKAGGVVVPPANPADPES